MDIYSTAFLQGVIENLVRPSTFLSTRYFNSVQKDDAEEVYFDVVNKKRRMAPYVSPMVAGKVVTSNGFQTKKFKPPYVKDKRPLTTRKALKRAAGEKIGGSLSGMDRRAATVVLEIADQMEMITRRKEHQAMQALREGRVIVSGEDYPEQEVNYQRHPDNNVVLVGGQQWSQSSSSPMRDLKALHGTMLKNGGGGLSRDVIMSADAWDLFSTHEKIAKKWDQKDRVNVVIDEKVAGFEGAAYQGTMDSFNFFTYQDWVEDADGVAVSSMGKYEVLLAGSLIGGVQHHAAILDEDAGFQAVEFFSKTWVEKDPSVRQILMQSSFLMVPYRPNASACMTVVSE